MPGMSPFVSFLAIAAVATLLPGPDTFVVLRTALAEGPRAGSWAAAGSASGNIAWGAASSLGVAAVLAASASAFAVLRLAGAAYLAVLGARALLAAKRGDGLAAGRDPAVRTSRAAAYRRGLASDLLNVKVGLFWTALVPQVLAAGGGPLLAPAMVVTMGAMVFAWLTASAHIAARLSGALARRGSARAVNASVGVVFLALGVGLGLARSS